MEKVALFFDIDGTLFDGKSKSILPSTIELLDELSKKDNYDIYISSGRSYKTLGIINNYTKYFKGYNLTNGQEIIISGNKYYGQAINEKTLVKILK